MAKANAQERSDIRAGTWVDRVLPPFLHPYARLARWDRPIGSWLLLLPTWWGIALGAHVVRPLEGMADIRTAALYAVLVAIGAVAMRGAGCTWNDITDREFDGRVARTATRPIPAGEVSVLQALFFLALQCLVGLAVLLFFPVEAIVVAIASLGLVAAYPFMKRITYFPQAWLGMTFNWGVLVGFTGFVGFPGSWETALPALCFYGAGFFWTMGYDTIYAHQDKEDDILIGVKSTALRFGGTSGYWVGGFYACTVALLALGGAIAAFPWPFWIGLALAAAHWTRQVVTVDYDDHRNCLRQFKSNRDAGLAVALGTALSLLA